MQGGGYGDRPMTPVQTPTEIAKFNRDVLGFLSDKNGGATRIDWQAFAAKWNNDVKETEDNLRNQLLVENAEEEKEAEDDDDAPANVSPRMPRRLLTNCINRKRVQDLEHYWVQSRKITNARLTMEPHQQRMSQLEREQRVVCREGDPGILPHVDKLVASGK